MDNTIFLFPNLAELIVENESTGLSFKNQLMSNGKSPSCTVQVRVISCPDFAGPLSKANGTIWGRTGTGDQRKVGIESLCIKKDIFNNTKSILFD